MTTIEVIDTIIIRESSETRFHKFLDWAPSWYGKNYWYALAIAYTCSDNLYALKDEVKAAFSAKRKYRESLMEDKELKIWRNLPEHITIYRGMTLEEKESGDYGVSWTLSKKTAEFFAYKYQRNRSTNHLPRTVHKLIVKKNDVVAYFGERNEKEIIYLHKVV